MSLFCFCVVGFFFWLLLCWFLLFFYYFLLFLPHPAEYGVEGREL